MWRIEYIKVNCFILKGGDLMLVNYYFTLLRIENMSSVYVGQIIRNSYDK